MFPEPLGYFKLEQEYWSSQSSRSQEEAFVVLVGENLAFHNIQTFTSETSDT